MSRVVTIHQPDFAPWLGFFHRLWLSDLYVVLDDAQFLRRGWHHRDKIKTPTGSQWLTLPVKKRGRFKERINEVELQPDSGWRESHLKTLSFNYRNAPYFNQLYPQIASLYAERHQNLVQFNLSIIHWISEMFEINFEFALASELTSSLKSNERLIELTNHHKGTTYLTGHGCRSYLDPQLFEAENIMVDWQRFTHPNYQQQFGSFIPQLSSFDYLFNCGPGNPFVNHAS